jgi:hypothetical protein
MFESVKVDSWKIYNPEERRSAWLREGEMVLTGRMEDLDH